MTRNSDGVEIFFIGMLGLDNDIVNTIIDIVNSVRFLLQNLPKMCILWVCLAYEMAGKRL
jgi:hypothetical protein